MKQFSFQTNVITALLTVFIFHLGFSQDLELSIQTDRPGAKIQPTMWGIFFEDINFAADGGIYAELVKNRSFEFDAPLMGWQQPESDRHSLNENSGMATIFKTNDDSDNNFVRIKVNNGSGYVLINEGFRGMGIKKDDQYNLSFEAKPENDGITKIIFQLIDKNNKVIGETSITPDNKDWKKYEGVIK